MNSDLFWTVLPWGLAVLFYIEAGRRCWGALFLSLPERYDDPLAKAVRANAVPRWFKLIYIVLWGPIQVIAFFLARWHEFQVRQGKSLPEHLK